MRGEKHTLGVEEIQGKNPVALEVQRLERKGRSYNNKCVQDMVVI